MGDKIQYYCLNEPMTCDILPSQSVIFGHRLCAHQALHSQIPPEPNGGSVASTSALHPQHSHPHRELLHKQLDQLLPIHPPVPEHTVNSAQSSQSHQTGQNRGKSPGGHPAMVYAVSLERPAHLFVSALEYSHRFTNPPLFILQRQIPYALVLARSSVRKITGHLAAHLNITVQRDVSRKPVQSVEQNRFRVSAGPLQHSTERQLKVKCKGHASSQRTECGELKFSPCYIFLTQTNICIIHHSYSSYQTHPI